MYSVTIQLKSITPIFLGGAEPNQQAELRAPSVKGALRYWYRAIDPNYKTRGKGNGPTKEETIFGSAGFGTGLFRLCLSGPMTGKDPFEKSKYQTAFTVNQNKPDVKNGAIYLGYSLEFKDNRRKAIPAGSDIVAKMFFKSAPSTDERRAVVAAWWLLGHVGGLGSRSRRGFGTVALQNWEVKNDDKSNDWQELHDLPIAHLEKTPEAWFEKFKEGLVVLTGAPSTPGTKGWFGSASGVDHLILGDSTKFYLSTKGYASAGNKNIAAWETALNEAGLLMQGFRQRYGLGTMGDYDNVKGHLRDAHPYAPCTGVTIRPLSRIPDRIAFGLPLSFRFPKMEYPKKDRAGNLILDDRRRPIKTTPNITFQGEDHDRNASPIYIRVIQIGSKCYPFFARFDTPILEPGERVAYRGNSLSNPAPLASGASILDNFCTTLKACSFDEVAWRNIP